MAHGVQDARAEQADAGRLGESERLNEVPLRQAVKAGQEASARERIERAFGEREDGAAS